MTSVKLSTMKVFLMSKHSFIPRLLILLVLLVVYSQWEAISNISLIKNESITDFLQKRMLWNSVKVSEAAGGGIKFVLIVAYFRSGSSFTSEIFNQHGKSFYLFEPVQPIWSPEKSYITYLNGTKRYFNTTEEQIAESKKNIQNWFDCNIEEIFLEGLIQKSFLVRTRRIQSYFDCLGSGESIDEVKKCIFLIKRVCENSTLRLIKIIRVNVTVLENMLTQNTNMHLLHLVRDPRAILHSRQKVHLLEKNSFKIASGNLCPSMEADLNSSSILQQRFQNRVRVVRYETVAMNPISEARRLYEYIGLTPSFDDLARFYCKAFAGDSSNNPYATTSSNSSLVPTKWFKFAKKNVVREIDILCRGVYKQLGYFSIDSEQHLLTGDLFEKNFTRPKINN